MPGTQLNQQSRKNPNQRTYKVLIADDHNIFRHGLKTLLNKYPFIKFSGEASNGKELVKMAKEVQPDLIFMDIHMPGGDGIEATTEIRKLDHKTKIIILSSYDDAIMVKKMMDLGASAYLTKTITLQLLDTLFEKMSRDEVFISPDAATNMILGNLTTTSSPVMEKHTEWLEEEITPRQKQVLEMLAKGKSTKQIASQLSLGSRTVETHKENLMKKLGVKSTVELMAVAQEYKLI